MKIFVTSDLHLGQSEETNTAVRAIASRLQDAASADDVLLLGGDYGNTDAETEACLRCFRNFRGHILAVPGNHDVWVGSGDTSANRLRRFRTIAEGFGIHSLHHAPKVINGTAFVGSIGWYDYSFRDNIGVSRAQYESKRSGSYVWADGMCAKWTVDDQAMTSAFAGLLESHLFAVSRAKPDAIIGLIHHVPVKGLLFHPRFLVPKEWRFLNTFLGAERFGELFTSFGVRQVFCGHLHAAKRVRRGRTTFQSLKQQSVIVYERGKTKSL